MALRQPLRGDGGSGSKPFVGLPASPLTGLKADQIARAQAAQREGQAGGGWESKGGFVDQGPLSFDTTWYDWGPYAAEMIRRIKLHWEIPGLAHYGIQGWVTIRFFIEKDGRVTGATIVKSSGIPPYENAALQAILTSSPFRPLPADLGHDREGVTVTFLYNMRPGDENGGSPPSAVPRSRGRARP